MRYSVEMSGIRDAEVPMTIRRLPPNLIRVEGVHIKDHVVVIDNDTAHPLALRVNGRFAVYLTNQIAELSASPSEVYMLERRLERPGLTPESRRIFENLIRTARRLQEQTQRS
jgi:hypothetical protein